MGCPDSIIGLCPFCGTEYSGQTKQFENYCHSYMIGDQITDKSISMRLGLKDLCLHCNKRLVAVIKDGILIGLEQDQPDCIEGLWGSLSVPS